MNDDRGASIVELVPLKEAGDRYDVAIVGGGLAGLTLAIQLKRQRPHTTIGVLEKRDGPAPDAAFKVGESTVLSGAHYFSDVVGLRSVLQKAHVRKCSLRFFLPADGNADITQRLEVGGPGYPPHDDYQIDRGRFENSLAAHARGLGVDVLTPCRVTDIELGIDHHTVAFTQLEAERTLRARWVVDGSGRASVLKRKLGLAREVPHHINSAWLRLRDGLNLEEWGHDDSEWMARMFEPGIRQFSTNHLLGHGYWVWMIPLGSGSISIGVCADPRMHPFEEINELPAFLQWLSHHEPQLAASLMPRLDDVQDFLRVRDFAYSVERVYSPDRWSLIGEAAAFADPFYSPGSDMIGYGNTFAADLIVRDLDGEEIAERLDYFNDFYLRTFEHVLSRTQDHYATFGNPGVCAVKIAFDNVVHHAGAVIVFLKDKLTDLRFMRSVDADIDRIYRLSIRVQQVLRDWNEHETIPSRGPARGGVHKLLFESLVEPVQDYSDDDLLRAAVQKHVRWVEALTVLIFHKAAAALGHPCEKTRRIDPYAVSLRGQSDGSDSVYSDSGWELAEAAAVCEGFENVWLDGVKVAG